MLVLDACNLLGDTLYLLDPAKRFASQHDNIALLYFGSAAPLSWSLLTKALPDLPVVSSVTPRDTPITLRAGDAAQKCFGKHISQGFCALLNIPWISSIPDLTWLPRCTPPQRNVIGINPFSISGQRDRILSEEQWTPLLDYLGQYGEPEIIAWREQSFSRYPRFVAQTIDELCCYLRSCKCIVTMESGIAHLASAVGVPTICLWTHNHTMQVIAPTWAPDTGFIVLTEPAMVPVSWIQEVLRSYVEELQQDNRRLLGSLPRRAYDDEWHGQPLGQLIT